MWQRRMAAFLSGKGQILWDVTVNTAYVHSINFLAPGSRDMFDANNNAVDYLYRSLCQSEFDRVLLTVYIRIKVQVDLQVDKSSVVVKGPFFPQV
jgi:hypothetical protein